MHTNLLTKARLSQLLIVDMQTRLTTAMQADEMQFVIHQCSVLAKAAAMLDVPVSLTEQYPKGLGHTVPELLEILPSTKAVEKTAFSCLAEPKFSRQLTIDRSQIIIAGMEAHICVLQTSLDLLASGKQVFVVEDAIISRNPANKANAIARMSEAGCVISNTESIVFEWLEKAEGDTFKTISRLIK